MAETRQTRTNRSYILQPYIAEWPKLFADIKPQLKKIFGDNAISIEHIGSTSVPGMTAKPQIDILALVTDLTKVKTLYADMEALGFKARGDYIEQNEESFIKDDASGHRLYSIHTMQIGNPNAEMYILLRDYLRSHSEARDTYTKKKQELLAKFGAEDYNAYDFGKEVLLAKLKSQAIAWRESQTS